MKTKELLDEIYKLRRELDSYNYFMAKNMINFLEMLRDDPRCLDIDKMIKGYKQLMEDLK